MPKKKLPDTERRVGVWGRVLPSTKQALEAMGCSNLGRAIDMLVMTTAPKVKK